jgi:hypothetical protein
MRRIRIQAIAEPLCSVSSSNTPVRMRLTHAHAHTHLVAVSCVLIGVNSCPVARACPKRQSLQLTPWREIWYGARKGLQLHSDSRQAGVIYSASVRLDLHVTCHTRTCDAMTVINMAAQCTYKLRICALECSYILAMSLAGAARC